MTYGTSSGKTSKISALDITESHCNCTLIGDPGCTIIPKQKSAKFSGNTATAGFYSDTVDVNVVFKTSPSKSGKGYVLETNYYDGDPYDIKINK